MQVKFKYDKEKDIWCLLNKGKSSSNSQTPTKIYEKLVAECGENLTPEVTSIFIEKYILDNSINLEERTREFQKDWDEVSIEFQKRARAIFGVSLPQNVTAYLTVNTRCPYSIENNYFYVSIQGTSARKTVLHELWHFYTWYGVGPEQEQKVGKQKYNDLKEALTVLLNIECRDLLPEGVEDAGYPQHKELREKILNFWAKEKNMSSLWEYLQSLV